MPATFRPPPIPSDQSITLGRVREDVRQYARALEGELLKLTAFTNTLQPRGEFHIGLALSETETVF